MRPGLTDRQAECLEFIKGYIESHGAAPTIREVGEALGLVSTNGPHQIIKALERRGYIKVTPGCARAISVIPDDVHQAKELLRAIPGEVSLHNVKMIAKEALELLE